MIRLGDRGEGFWIDNNTQEQEIALLFFAFKLQKEIEFDFCLFLTVTVGLLSRAFVVSGKAVGAKYSPAIAPTYFRISSRNNLICCLR